MSRFLCFCILLAGSIAASAQGKIGIINLREVFDKYHKTITADARLKDQAADLDKERKAMMDQYQKTTDDYKAALEGANDQAVSADEREKRKKTAESKLLDIKKLETDIRQFDNQARATLEATLAIEYSMASGSAVTLPLGDRNFFLTERADRGGE